MNFSGIYQEEQFYEGEQISWIDLSDISGTNCYCDGDAQAQILERMEKYPVSGIYFIDSGNYHYMSRIGAGRVEKPFRLLVFDNHTDMQLPAFGGLLSCGGWIAASLEELPLLEKVILIGPDQEAFDQTEPVFRQKVQYLSREKLRIMTPEEKRAFFKKMEMDYPMYISVDKDVLCKDDASTTWSQGDMTLEELCQFVEILLDKQQILGMDVCGECDPDACDGNALNDRANQELLRIWKGDKRL